MTESVTGRITAHDDLELLARRWEVDDPTAVVVVVHGLGEHSGRHDPIGTHLAARSMQVHAFDIRGFGRSEGKRAHVESIEHYHADLKMMIDAVRIDGLPLVLLGHSMGGLVALDHVLSGHSKPDLLVLSSPAVGSTLSGWKKWFIRTFGGPLSGIALPNEIEGKQLSTDPDVGEEYFADPYVYTKTTLGLAKELLEAIDRVRAGWHSLDVPTLVIHGGGDTVVPPYTSTELGQVPGVQRVLFPTFRHECFNEPEGDVALRTVSDWILGKIMPSEPPGDIYDDEEPAEPQAQ